MTQIVAMHMGDQQIRVWKHNVSWGMLPAEHSIEALFRENVGPLHLNLSNAWSTVGNNECHVGV